ncbi:ABC transporter permease [Alicyclobacillus mengziensis]|uniref:ABC transporter permease n=1 Tax=Alicyclobacillus mengziensis TaxID=2931921 RepID=A0A9X7VXD7_9BACL|nr:ABC transporter permease [Alicyclobacillus mengziensis]
MMWNGLLSEIRREWILFRRYPTELLSQLVVIVVAFYGLFLGASYMAGSRMVGGRLDAVIIGYLLWTLAMGAVGAMGWDIMNEAQNGTLEQVMLSPLGLMKILLLRSIVLFIYNILFTAVVLFIIMWLTGRHLSVSGSEVVPFGLAMACAIGIGYLVASVTILFKRSNQFLGLLQFVLLFLVMAPFASLHGWRRLASVMVPIAPMNAMLRQMMIAGGGLTGPHNWLLWSVLNAGIWLLLGMFVFVKASKRAKRKGILGHY